HSAVRASSFKAASITRFRAVDLLSMVRSPGRVLALRVRGGPLAGPVGITPPGPRLARRAAHIPKKFAPSQKEAACEGAGGLAEEPYSTSSAEHLAQGLAAVGQAHRPIARRHQPLVRVD